MKVLPTTYKGVRFKSRTEARWAVFFDLCNLLWDYEPEGFDLAVGFYYLPDFKLPEMELWVEVKSEKPLSRDAWLKAISLADETEQDCLVVQGQPRHRGHLHLDSEGGECRSEFSSKYTLGRYDGAPRLYENNGMGKGVFTPTVRDPEIERLFEQARGHRFSEATPRG